MSIRWLPMALWVPLLAAHCGQPAPVTEEMEEPQQVVPISGLYQVKGVTEALESGHKREIAGTVVLSDHGGRYTATFELETTYPGQDQALPADVIGKGEGTIEDRTLRGVAETQLVMATVPGVDPGFAYIPRVVSTRIRSSTLATIAPDGGVSIQIENQPAEGESYAPTRTTLKGERVSAAGLGGPPEAGD